MKASIYCIKNYAQKASWLNRLRKYLKAAHAVLLMILTILFSASKPSSASVVPVFDQFLLNEQAFVTCDLSNGTATTRLNAFCVSASRALNIGWQLNEDSRDALAEASGVLAFHFINNEIASEVQVFNGRLMLTKIEEA